MTTKETEIPTFYLTKKKKQIYKITVWNILLVFFCFVFYRICFHTSKKLLIFSEAHYDKWEQESNKAIYLCILQGWDVNHRCLKTNVGKRRGRAERTKFKRGSNCHWFCMKTFGMFSLRGHDDGKWSCYEFNLKSQKVPCACALCTVSVWSMPKSRSALQTSPGF